MDWNAMALDARNLAYNNVEHVGPAFARDKTESWRQKSLGTRARDSGHLDLPYADAARTKWDLYPSENPNAPCLVHVHGGYWQRGSKEIFACLTEGVRAHGWSAALPGYSLAPDASLSQIVSELRLALDWFAENARHHGVGGAVILTGWSAGGHLTALLLDHPAVKTGFCISGVFDLGHLRESPHVNDKLRLTETEVEELSPMRLPMADKPLTISHGSSELPAMIQTSREFHQRRMMAHRDGELVAVPGKNHFTILDELLNPRSGLVSSILALA